MPYYKGAWHRYSEADRQAYGERKRAAESVKWHKQWISKQGLKERLWTEKAIADFLDDPLPAGAIKAWKRTDVIAAEATKAFKAWMVKRKAWLDARGKTDA